MCIWPQICTYYLMNIQIRGRCMKIKALKFIKRNKTNNDKNRFLENILFGTCIICFAILVIIQSILAVPTARDALNLSDKSIGVPLSNDEYLYDQGQIKLKMIGNEPDPTVRILINGEPVAMFENIDMDISVKDGDVIEIDGSESIIGHIIKVESCSANISNKCRTAVANVESNIQRLVRVQVD